MNTLKNIVQNQYYQKLMFLVILGYTFTYIPFESIGHTFRTILILGTVIAFISEGKEILKDPIFLFLFFALIIPVLSWINASNVIPDVVSSTPKLDRLARILTFFFVAYWLKASLRRIYSVWVVFILGFFLACILSPNFTNEINNAILGIRVDFGIKNAQFTSMISGIIILISLFSFPQTYNSSLTPRLKQALYILFLCSLCIATFITISSQSRQVWIALIITIISLPLFHTLMFGKIKYLIPAYLSMIIIVIIASQSTLITNRLMTESSTINAIINGDSIPMSSIGIRVNSWIEASYWIKNNPILGASSEAIGQVIQQSKIFNSSLKANFGHLHNYYIEVLVAYGLIGFSFVVSLYYWMLRSMFIYRSKAQKLTVDAINYNIIYSCCLIMYWFIVNCFETYNSRSFGVFVQTLVFASIYTFYLHDSLKERHSSE